MAETRANGSPAERRHERSWTGRIRSAFVRTTTEPSAFERDLRAAVAGEVDFGAQARALYATDASNYRQVPMGVVLPRSVEDVIRAVEIARAHDAPVVPRGGGTSLAGQTCNTGLVLDFSRHLDRVLSIDAQARTARVEPGCIPDTLSDAAAPHGLIFGPDPATHTHNTIGGMIGNNSGGVHSVMAGLTVDNVESLDVLTYDGLRMEVGPTDDKTLAAIIAEGGRRGDVYKRLKALRDAHGDRIRSAFPDIPRRVSGFSNLDWLLPELGFHVARALVGTEATCVIVLGATVRLVPDPPERITVILGFPDIYRAADAVPAVLEHEPLACEGLDRTLISNMQTKGLHEDKVPMLPEGEGWLVVELGGASHEEAVERGRRLAEAMEAGGVTANLLEESEKQTEIRLLRESGLGATAYVPGLDETWEGWEDTAVPREKLGAYLREFRKLLDRYGYDTAMYGHFGDGLVHCRINFDLSTEEGLKTFRAFLDEAAKLVVSFGGSLSGEHGDGQARARLLEIMYGSEMLEVFRAFKAIWDPDGRMNPGKAVDAYPVTANLRVGPNYSPPKVTGAFAYEAEGGSFTRAINRCVGVGKCRRLSPDGEVMCPSYMATREEKHSTRGRARLLFEMLREGPIADGWRSEAVEDALDLCFACKGCKSDCPVNVDMATYKAEFRARHYAGRLRPRVAYTMGMIHRWAGVGARVPTLANAATALPGSGAVARFVAGIAPGRAVPRFAEETFSSWFARRPVLHNGGERVVFWPDTFNDHFHPETAKAAVLALEAAGFSVTVPAKRLCCGRALYDWGLLDTAKGLLREAVEALRPEIEAGTPVVGIEPACVSALRDELPGLLGDDPLARRLSAQTRFFSEFLDDRDVALPETPGRAVVQLHCHQHAVLDAGAEWRLLDRLGIEVAARPAGCCGMAGSLGFERGKQAVSEAAARRALLPAVEGSDGAMVVANGFSCREQVAHFTGIRAWHVAELAAKALRQDADSEASTAARSRSPTLRSG